MIPGFFFNFLVVLGFEFKALCLLGKGSVTWTTLPALFDLVIFQFGSCAFCLIQPCTVPLYLSLLCRWGYRHVPLPYLFEIKILVTFLVGWALSPDPHISTSQEAEITGMYPHSQTSYIARYHTTVSYLSPRNLWNTLKVLSGKTWLYLIVTMNMVFIVGKKMIVGQFNTGSYIWFLAALGVTHDMVCCSNRKEWVLGLRAYGLKESIHSKCHAPLRYLGIVFAGGYLPGSVSLVEYQIREGSHGVIECSFFHTVIAW
jgi:hypothetical protein